MSDKPLRYFLELGGELYPVRDVEGVEAISSTFRFDLRFHIGEHAALDPDALVKSRASLRLEREGVVRVIDGLVTDISVGAVIRGAPLVELVLEPHLALARLRSDIRLFRDKTAPQIVSEVLGGLGIRHEMRLGGSYEMRPYCVQHRESDFDFVSRLLEDEGIFYYFAPGDLLVIGDGSSAYDAIAGAPVLPFHAGFGLDVHGDAVHAFGERASLGASTITLRDFNPDKPSLDMDVQASASAAPGAEYYDYPGEYLDPGVGAQKARMLAEAMACAAASFEGESYSGRLAPGHTFSLTGAPQGTEDGEYVVTSVDHNWKLDQGGFSIAFGAMHGKVAVRPERKTPVPRLTNPITGFVTGPAGSDVHTDELGRVKVHFQWDRLFPHDDTCSHWIPVVQDNTGHSVGIPRVGWEVLVHFLEGDPDRPVVLGRVYNAADKFSVPLPARKTVSSLQSMCSPGRDGRNEVQFEDKAGKEYIFLHAEKDHNIVIANDKREHVKATESTIVKRDETIAIGKDHELLVGVDANPTVERDQTLLTKGKRKLEISNVEDGTVKGNRKMSIGGMHFRKVKTSDIVTADVLKETVGGVIMEAFLKANSTEVGEVMMVTVGGAIIEVAKVSKSEGCSKGRVDLVGGIVYSKADDTIKSRTDKTRTTTVGGTLKIDAAKEIVLTGAEKVALSSAIGKVSATKGSVTLKVGETVLEMKDDTIRIKTTKTIKLTVRATNDQGADVSTQI